MGQRRQHGLDSAWRTSLIGGGALTKTFNTPGFYGFLSIEYAHPFVAHAPDCRRPDAYTRDKRCPAPDVDGDGIPDHKDRCPKQAEDLDNFEDADGCPDVDNDKDGIKDAQDKCPLRS